MKLERKLIDFDPETVKVLKLDMVRRGIPDFKSYVKTLADEKAEKLKAAGK